jgi:hypothetical protein
MKQTEIVPQRAPYKRHPNPYHFNASTSYKQFYYNKRHHILHPKFNPQGIPIRAKLIQTNPSVQVTLPTTTIQKTPAKIGETPEKKVESSSVEIPQVSNENKEEVVSSGDGNVEADTTITEAVQDEDNLSNVSDSDDEILNREEVSFIYLIYLVPSLYLFSTNGKLIENFP